MLRNWDRRVLACSRAAAASKIALGQEHLLPLLLLLLLFLLLHLFLFLLLFVLLLLFLLLLLLLFLFFCFLIFAPKSKGPGTASWFVYLPAFRQSRRASMPWKNGLLSRGAKVPIVCQLLSAWMPRYIRGPKDHMNMRILHSGFKAQSKGDSRKRGL